MPVHMMSARPFVGWSMSELMSGAQGTPASAVKVEVHQLLHGYRGGHQRLTGSTRLDRHSERALLMLSDMSGPNMVPGFESYLTGYPLPDDRKYAFARTWYAPEMPRPGTVWTHTLLLDYDDVGRIQNLQTVLALFRRPLGAIDETIAYELPLTVEVAGLSEPLPRSGSDPAPLIEAIYGASTQVLLGADSAAAVEALVVAAWLQQWPKLRCTFRFCTGSLAHRMLEHQSFDLQVVPRSREPQIRRAAGTVTSVDLEKTPRSRVSAWAQVGAEDLYGHADFRFRRFLRYFADDAQPGRMVYSQLARFYIDLLDGPTRPPNLTLVHQRVTEWFPEPLEGARLKTWVFGPDSDAIGLTLPSLSERDKLSALVMTDRASALDWKTLAIPSRAAALARSDTGGALAVAAHALQSPSHLGEAFLLGLASAARDRPGLIDAAPDSVLTALVEANPDLACMPQLWRRSIDLARSTLPRASVETLTRLELQDCLRAMLAEEAMDGVRELVARAGELGVLALLDALVTTPASTTLADHGWSLVRRYPKTLLNWLDEPTTRQPAQIAHVVRELHRSREAVRLHGTQTWLRLLERASDSTASPETTLEVMAFALAIGLEGAEGRPYDLVAVSFERVHDSCAAGSLPQLAWDVLESAVVPRTSWWWWTDDRPYRLRITLVETFYRRQWPLTAFLASFGSTELLLECLHNAADTRTGRKFRDRLAEEITSGGICLTFDADEVLAALGSH